MYPDSTALPSYSNQEYQFPAADLEDIDQIQQDMIKL